METRAVAKYVRITPRKARQVMDLIRGKPVKEALAVLRFTPKAASSVVEKVLKSAVANAENNCDLNRDNLVVGQVFADQGPTMKRMMPRARGMANVIRKRTSHITVVVKERE
ncbi:MAG: 50S ribosomal protein L22 [Firmicutes bacterium]|nr:50S ribosomal protein L22 [Bacillota bacterium]